MTAKQLPGLYAPDGGQYVTLTDGAGNLVNPGGLPLTGGVVTGQFGVTSSGVTNAVPDGASWISFQAPSSKAFLLSTFDDQGRLTRAFSQPNGRTDAYSYSDAGAGPIYALNYSTATPANGDNIGHYAYRSTDGNGNFNTNAYILGNVTNVSTASMSGKLTFGVMSALSVSGSGNGQPNVSMTIDGATATVALPPGFLFARSGNELASAATGPTTLYTNTTNSTTFNVGIGDNFNGILNASGGMKLQVASTSYLTLTSTNVVFGTAAISTSSTNGFPYFPSGAGTPTGVPTTNTGRVPMYIDTTNSQLWLYIGGAWKQPKTPAGAALVTWQ